MTMLKLYTPFPIKVKYAKGVYIYDQDEKCYLDTFSGIGVMNLGHSHPEIIDKMHEKMQRHMHISNYFVDDDALFVAEKLVSFTQRAGKATFSNSGTEAIEASLKAVKKRGTPHRYQILHFSSSFHGRTTGALAVNGFTRLRDSFEPLIPGTTELKFNDVVELENYFKEHGAKVLAVYFEAIQGAGGVIEMEDKFAQTLGELHQKHKFILVADEIQAGLGRTGKIFSYQHYNLKPDIIAVGKALGAGLPLGACIFLDDFKDIFVPGDHGSTFAPSPIATAGAVYMLDSIPQFLEEIQEKGKHLSKQLAKIGKIKQIRGKGLMIGAELQEKDPGLRERALEQGLLLNVLAEKVIRFLPPFIITHKQIDELLDKLKKAL